MKDLEKDKSYHLGNLNEQQAGELFDWLKENGSGWTSKQWFININILENQCLEFDSELGEFTWSSTPKWDKTGAVTLFEGEVPFDKGDRDSLVLVSNDLVDWSVEEVVLEHKGLYYCDGEDGVLEPYKYLMKLTQEQKEYLNK